LRKLPYYICRYDLDTETVTDKWILWPVRNTSINFTCHNKDDNVVKTATSDEDAEVEENDNTATTPAVLKTLLVTMVLLIAVLER